MYTYYRCNTVALLLVAMLCGTYAEAQEVFFNPLSASQVFTREDLEDRIPTSLFDETNLLELQIESDFTHLEATKDYENNQWAMLRVKYSDSLYMRCPIQIRARGNSRKKYCDYPPIRMDFDSSDLNLSEFSGLSDLKIVSQCHPNSVYEGYLLREYLAYKVYQEITPFSYKTRLAKITYVNTGQQGESWEQFAFLLEDTDNVAERLGLIEVNRPSDKMARMDESSLATVSLIEFLLGNMDWHIISGHNIKYFQKSPDQTDTVYLVGYDFDLTGMVNPGYGVPLRQFNMINMQDRRFIGCGLSLDTLLKKTQSLTDQQIEIEEFILNFKPLSKEQRREIIRFLEPGFKQLTNPKKLEKLSSKRCISYSW